MKMLVFSRLLDPASKKKSYENRNYFFEKEKITDFRKKGVSKEHRPNPIVQMELFMDNKGMTTGDNICYTLSAGDGYVFSMSVRGANKELKKYVLDQDGYESIEEEYKQKSRLYPREIKVTGTSGKKLTKKIDEKQVVFYSEKYAKRAKAERAATLDKALDLVKHPSKYTRATSYGAAGYVKALDFDKETGEIIT